MSTPARKDMPYFVFEGEVSAVPSGPLVCRGCGVELEPLRRTGGYCKACVVARSPAPVPPTDALRSTMTVVRTFYRQRKKFREKFVEVECSCKRRRVLQFSEWVHHQPHSCNACRVRNEETLWQHKSDKERHHPWSKP